MAGNPYASLDSQSDCGPGSCLPGSVGVLAMPMPDVGMPPPTSTGDVCNVDPLDSGYCDPRNWSIVINPPGVPPLNNIYGSATGWNTSFTFTYTVTVTWAPTTPGMIGQPAPPYVALKITGTVTAEAAGGGGSKDPGPYGFQTMNNGLGYPSSSVTTYPHPGTQSYGFEVLPLPLLGGSATIEVLMSGSTHIDWVAPDEGSPGAGWILNLTATVVCLDF